MQANRILPCYFESFPQKVRVMSKRNIEIITGLLGAVGLAVIFVWVVQMNDTARNSSSNEAYEVQARFENVGGLKMLAAVKASGVKIGRVANIEYDTVSFEAVVTLSIESKYNNFPLDTAASVLSSGLFGEQYIALAPGAELEYLIQGSEIDITQSALIWEQIIGQFLYSNSK